MRYSHGLVSIQAGQVGRRSWRTPSLDARSLTALVGNAIGDSVDRLIDMTPKGVLLLFWIGTSLAMWWAILAGFGALFAWATAV